MNSLHNLVIDSFFILIVSFYLFCSVTDCQLSNWKQHKGSCKRAAAQASIVQVD